MRRLLPSDTRVRFETAARLPAAALVVALVVSGCSDSDGGASEPVGTSETAVTCEPGQMPVVDGSCRSVGPRQPGAGFSLHPDGWGHVAIKPGVACEGPQMARMGNTECVGIQDSSGAFPPSNAHAVVSTTEELTSAIESAPSGATIALRAGTYSAFEIRKAVRLVGQSTQDVVIQGSGVMSSASKGVTVSTDQEVALESMTIRAYGIAIWHTSEGSLDVANLYIADCHGGMVGAYEGTKLSVHDTILEGPDPTRKIWDAIAVASYHGAIAELENVELRGFSWPISARYQGSEIDVRNAVVQFEQRWPYGGAIEAWGGAKVTMADSAMSTSEGRFVAVGTQTPDMDSGSTYTPGRVEIRRSVLEHHGSLMDSSSALDVYQGATLELEDVSLRHEAFCGIGVSEGNSSVTVRNSLISAADARGEFHAHVVVTEGTANVFGSVLIGAKDFGLMADGSTAELNTQDSFIAGSVKSHEDMLGVVTGLDQSRLNLERTTLSDNEGIGVVGGEYTTISMSDVLVQRAIAWSELAPGIGAALQSARLIGTNSKFMFNEGPGLSAQDEASVLLLDSDVACNPVGLHLSEGIELRHAEVEPSDLLSGTIVLYQTNIQNNDVPVEVGGDTLLAE